MWVYRPPFNYYYSKYEEDRCPFCENDDSHKLHFFLNDDVVYCRAYKGYIVRDRCEALMGGEGFCSKCTICDNYNNTLGLPGFICEACNHGVSFGTKKVFQVLFNTHDSNNCIHCTNHNSKAPENPVEIPNK